MDVTSRISEIISFILRFLTTTVPVQCAMYSSIRYTVPWVIWWTYPTLDLVVWTFSLFVKAAYISTLCLSCGSQCWVALRSKCCVCPRSHWVTWKARTKLTITQLHNWRVEDFTGDWLLEVTIVILDCTSTFLTANIKSRVKTVIMIA